MKSPFWTVCPYHAILEGFFILMQKQPIPLNVLFKFNDSNALDTLRIWILLKNCFNTGVFYNYTYRSIGTAIGVSPETVRKHLPMIIKEGMAEISGKNLRMVGINKLKKDCKACVLIPIHQDKPNQIVEFRNAVLRNNYGKQQKAIQKKSNIVKIANQANGRLSKSQLKFIQKSGGMDKLLKSIEKDNNCITLSNKGFGKKVHRSQSTGYRLQRTLRNMGYLKSYSRWVVVKTNSSIYEYIELYRNGGYVYNKDTREITRQLSNQIVPMQL